MNRAKYTNERRLQTITLPNRTMQKVLAYDRLGRPTKVQRGEQTPTEVRYNSRGQPETITRSQRTITYTYTPTGKLKSITDPDGNIKTLAYDAADRASRVTGSDGHMLNVELDTEGRPIQGSLNSQSGGLLRRLRFTAKVIPIASSLSVFRSRQASSWISSPVSHWVIN